MKSIVIVINPQVQVIWTKRSKCPMQCVLWVCVCGVDDKVFSVYWLTKHKHTPHLTDTETWDRTQAPALSGLEEWCLQSWSSDLFLLSIRHKTDTHCTRKSGVIKKHFFAMAKPSRQHHFWNQRMSVIILKTPSIMFPPPLLQIWVAWSSLLRRHSCAY